MYVSSVGNDSLSGEINSPYKTIQKAVDVVTPGDTIYVRGGTYYLSTTIRIKAAQTGTSSSRIYLWGYPGESVIIDGSQIPHSNETTFKMARCIYVNHEGNYWHFKNLELCNAKDNGMKIEGSYNIIENCRFYKNNDTGLQIGMYKDFSIEETKSLPDGDPMYNPGYQFCRNNIVLNCDSWYNNDALTYSGGSDDGGDADGFACKLFPGPGTEFHGCRGWYNSDDNWDLYMVYHPVVIADCQAWKAGYDSTGEERGNGNGFKLGGGGSSGGAAFDQSVGAHLVHNCLSFENANKGFDQNNAYEAMYLFNNVAWGNDYNYRFPTLFEYGTMYMRNNIGWGAGSKNHEFLSADKEGARVPDTDYNSWTTIDGCDPYKEGNKVGGISKYTQDHSAQFKNLTSALFLAARQADGSLPENDLIRLVDNSYFIDTGQIVKDFALTPSIPDSLRPVGYEALSNLTIFYNDASADMGVFETGIATYATLTVLEGKLDQLVYTGTAISPVVIQWGAAATGAVVQNLPQGLTAHIDTADCTITLQGVPSESGMYTITAIGGLDTVLLSGTVTISLLAPATLVCLDDNESQDVAFDNAIQVVCFVKSGLATTFEISGLPAGLIQDVNGDTLTISGIPTEDGTYTVSVIGGMETITLTGTITRSLATRILTGDWYAIQDAFLSMPEDLKGCITLYDGSVEYPTVWNPTYVESSGSAPDGFTVGAINVERNGGAVSWQLPSLAEFKANIHYTGGRTIQIQSVQNGDTATWNSGSVSKGTFPGYDLMDQAGIAQTQSPVTVIFTNLGTSGGIRIYDFMIRVYDSVATAFNDIQLKEKTYNLYQTETALIVYGDMARLTVYSLQGRIVAQSSNSQVVDIHQLPAGVYVVRMEDNSGDCSTGKFVK